MLVLERKQHQQIIINGNITVTVESIRGNRVKLSIEAPANINVRRAELEEEPKAA